MDPGLGLYVGHSKAKGPPVTPLSPSLRKTQRRNLPPSLGCCTHIASGTRTHNLHEKAKRRFSPGRMPNIGPTGSGAERHHEKNKPGSPGPFPRLPREADSRVPPGKVLRAGHVGKPLGKSPRGQLCLYVGCRTESVQLPCNTPVRGLPWGWHIGASPSWNALPKIIANNCDEVIAGAGN